MALPELLAELAWPALRALGQSVFAVLRWLAVEALWNAILLNLGRVALLIVTAGKFPRRGDLSRSADAISFAGLAVLVLLWLAVALVNNPQLLSAFGG